MKLRAPAFRALLPIMAIAALGAGLTACASSSTKAAPPSTAPAATTESAPASAAPNLSPRQLQFVTDARTTLSFGNSVQDGALASFGQHVCRARQAGATVAAEVPAAQQVGTGISKGDAVQMITLAEKDMCPAEAGPQQVTYVVTGSGAHVTYGPSGSNFEGSAPLSVSQPLGQPQFYSINAQVTGGGSVTCLLKVDGVTIASDSAKGSGNIASCEIAQDLNGSWEATNVSG
jgi:Protein of unknown function (DUF732)